MKSQIQNLQRSFCSLNFNIVYYLYFDICLLKFSVAKMQIVIYG